MPKILNRELRKKEILEAAQVVFTEKGYTNGTLKDIAKQANISTGSLYYIYKTKEEIFKDNMIFLSDKMAKKMEPYINYEGEVDFKKFLDIFFETIEIYVKERKQRVILEFYLEAMRTGKYSEYMDSFKDISKSFENAIEKVLKKVFSNHEKFKNSGNLDTFTKIIFFVRTGIVKSIFTGQIEYTPESLKNLKSEFLTLSDTLLN